MSYPRKTEGLALKVYQYMCGNQMYRVDTLADKFAVSCPSMRKVLNGLVADEMLTETFDGNRRLYWKGRTPAQSQRYCPDFKELKGYTKYLMRHWELSDLQKRK